MNSTCVRTLCKDTVYYGQWLAEEMVRRLVPAVLMFGLSSMYRLIPIVVVQNQDPTFLFDRLSLYVLVYKLVVLVWR